MEDLKVLLDTHTMQDVQKYVNQFIHSADEYSDQLKLALVLMRILQDSTDLLCSIDKSTFLTAIQKEMEEKTNKAHEKCSELNAQITENEKIAGLLSKGDDNELSQKEADIRKLLKEYEVILNRLREARDKLPIQKQIELEKS